MIATSLSTQTCPTGLCGQCGPCRREMREADRLMIPKALPPIELSPTAREIMAEDIEPCTQCHQPRGLTRGRIDGVGTLCTVCYDKPNLQHIIDTITATPIRTKAQNTAISRARLRIQRITHNGRPYHPNAPHGTDNSYICYQCRCEPCTQAHANLDKARR